MPASTPASGGTVPPEPRGALPRSRRAAIVIVAVTLGLIGALVAVFTLRSDEPAPSGAGGAATTTTAAKPTGRVVLDEQFDGTTLDAGRWKAYDNSYGDGNNELACLKPANVVVADGLLRITARRETIQCRTGGQRRFTSGFIGSREAGFYLPRYGRFEMRARLPHGQGLWPAFWLRHRDGAKVAEVDIMEYFHVQKPGQTTATLHWLDNPKATTAHVAFEQPTASPGWHTWAVTISPDPKGTRFEFEMDGTVYHSYVEPDTSPMQGDPTRQWDIAINLAVGGDWVGDPDGRLGCLDAVNRCFDKAAVRAAELPATYEVDWVRVTAMG